MATMKSARRSGVRESHDSTLERPIVRLEEYGFEVGRSLLGDVRYVGDRAASEARLSADPITIGTARILDVLELVLRRRKDGTVRANDEEVVRTLERVALKHLETRRREEFWGHGGWELRARDGFDRAHRVRHLVDHAGTIAAAVGPLLDKLVNDPVKWKTAVRHRARDAAIVLVSIVWTAKILDTKGRDREADVATLTRDFERRFKEPLTAELLARRALVACGLSRDDAKNWTRTGHVSKE